MPSGLFERGFVAGPGSIRARPLEGTFPSLFSVPLSHDGAVSRNPPLEESRGPEARPWMLALALVVVTLAAYHPAWNAGFIWDDDMYVTQNPLLTAPDGLRRIWFSLDSPSQYFPLTYTTFYVERALWGLHPAGYHRINLLLHCRQCAAGVAAADAAAPCRGPGWRRRSSRCIRCRWNRSPGSRSARTC